MMQVNKVLDSFGAKRSIFDEGLLIDVNQMPLNAKSSTRIAPAAPWNPYQQDISNVVVINEGDNIRMAIVGQETVKQLKALLDADRTKKAGRRDVQLLVMNLDSGLIQQGANVQDLAALEQNKQFIALKTQAKLYAGHLTYTREEQSYLTSWFPQHDPQQLRILIRDQILLNRPYARERYATSALEAIIEEMSSESP